MLSVPDGGEPRGESARLCNGVKLGQEAEFNVQLIANQCEEGEKTIVISTANQAKPKNTH